MAKKFNITGNCRAEKHYMADVSKKLARVYTMVEDGDYFVINRPRQYGKTTTLFSIADTFRKKSDYLVFNTSFEGIDNQSFANMDVFCKIFVKSLADEMMSSGYMEIADFINNAVAHISNMGTVSSFISQLGQKTDKKLVLLIDEVDKSSNNQLFLDFLGMLRNKYLRRDISLELTFQSVILAGVHDVKTLKLKLRPDAEQKYNSPWNIAAEFKVNMNLLPSEIKPMLEEYAADKGVTLDSHALAERLYYHTSGYPFLVSKLCKVFDEDMLPEKVEQTWTVSDVDKSVVLTVREHNTNFDTVVKNLENNPNLYDFVYKILVSGEREEYNIYDPIINLGIIHGILRNGSGVRIHNRIYEELIYNYMISRTKTHLTFGQYNNSKTLYSPDNGLNMDTVLLRFQAFMREQYSEKDHDFVERNGRLIFLAFLKPIINGSGYDFKEPQISEERRIDVTITYFQHKYVAELKIWYGEKAHQDGLEQLADYLDRLALTEGYLLVFNKNKKKTWKNGWITAYGKRIFIVWL